MGPILCVVFLSILVTVSSSDSPSYWQIRCGNKTYTQGSSYDQNMRMVSSILTSKISSTKLSARGFAGTYTERVYELAQCRGDAEISSCQRCVTKALQDVHLGCARSKSIDLYYNICALHLSDEMFSWNNNATKIAQRINSSHTIVQRDEFDRGVTVLMSGVAKMATNSSHRFATAHEEIDTEEKKYQAYGLVQCLPDMTSGDCDACLGILLFSYDLSGYVGWEMATTWCSCRFELYQFFLGHPVWTFPTLSNTTYKEQRSGKPSLIPLVVGVSVTATILLLLCTLFLWRKRCSSQQKQMSLDERPGNEGIETTEEGVSGVPGEDHSVDKVHLPSAITSFPEIITNLKGRKIALFLDYDGTLSPIVNDPEKAFMTSEMRDTVKTAAELFPISIVSGRSLVKVKQFVALDELHHAGSHGMDIQMSYEANIFSAASEYEPMITKATRSLTETTRSIMGATVENNVLCVSVHYRNVDEKEWDLVENLVKDTMQDFPDLILTRGHMVIELRPPIKWNKGNAVEYLLQRILQKLHLDVSQVLPIYIGDDLTDEDGFEVLREQNNGFGILVSREPRNTKAFYALKDPHEVMTFIGNLVGWRRITPEVLSSSSAREDDDEIVETSSRGYL